MIRASGLLLIFGMLTFLLLKLGSILVCGLMVSGKLAPRGFEVAGAAVHLTALSWLCRVPFGEKPRSMVMPGHAFMPVPGPLQAF